MRSASEKQHPFPQGSSQPAERQMLQVSDPSMNHSPGGRGGGRPEIPFINQGNAQTSLGSIQGYPGPIDSCADDQEVKRLIFELFRILFHVVKKGKLGLHSQFLPASSDFGNHRQARKRTTVAQRCRPFIHDIIPELGMQKNSSFTNLLTNCLEFKVVRYFFVGGVASVVDLSLFYILACKLEYHYLLAGAAAFTAAAVVNYFLSIRYVFISGSRFRGNREFAWVYVVSVIGLLLNQIILYIGVGALHQDMMLSKIAAIGLVFGWNYLARKHFVFKAVDP